VAMSYKNFQVLPQTVQGESTKQFTIADMDRKRPENIQERMEEDFVQLVHGRTQRAPPAS